jgi:5-(carboxyamino)imidazole ribonucleotide mutase
LIIFAKQFENNMVGIIMGSISDWPIMKEAADILAEFGVSFEKDVVSAHRTPEKMLEYAKNARSRGIKVIIAGAGGAAHLPGMVASATTLPVIGVPIKSSNSIDGWDSVLSILQMPGGVPVATMALNGAKNAGIFAAQILGVENIDLAETLDIYKKELIEKVSEMATELNK